MSRPIRFLAVIGLYRTTPHDSASFQSLRRACSALPADQGDIRILLYDNTPGGEQPCEVPPDIRYYRNAQNDGLADAFNFALEMAVSEGCEWLITLDQDTTLPVNFLARVSEIAGQVKYDSSIAAIVPQISEDDRMLSPNWFLAGALPRWFPKGFVGVPAHPTFAFNSASVLRLSALREIGGYCRWFWLDHCDSVLYHELNRIGKKVFVAGDLQVAHEFSMLNKAARMSLSRYRNVLLSESAFWDLAMNRLARIERTLRLVGRWARYAINGNDPAFRKETAMALKRRLFYSRAARLELWKEEMKALRPSLANAPDPLEQSKWPKQLIARAR